MRDVTLTVSDMACEGCAETVREALEEVPGVEGVEVSLDRGEARITAGEGTSHVDLATAVEDAGYTVESTA
ncbi:MAG: cation transporter [Candidatus Palauibacterales bacterium]|nr:cation transporter [Candidatus Palauibacterales bacterium]